MPFRWLLAMTLAASVAAIAVAVLAAEGGWLPQAADEMLQTTASP